MVGDRVYYRKAFVNDDVIYCFSFEYGYEHRDVCGSYIEYMEDHFKKN